MAEVIIGLEGQTGDVNDLAFSLFEAGMLREGLERETPGGAIIVLKPMAMRKGIGHGIIEFGLIVGDKVVLPLFLAWLYDKWKKAGEKPISVKIENHFYQPDPELLSKAIQEALNKHKKGDR